MAKNEDEDLLRTTANDKMLKYFGKMLDDSLFSDVKIQVKTATFSAHRCILAAHSEVFQAMFDTDMMEKESGTVVIEDLEIDGVREMLKFMYTLEPSQFLSFSKARDIYRASHKYQVHELYKIMQSQMASNVQESTVLDLMELATEYDDSGGKDAAFRYLVKEKPENLDFERCATIVRKYPTIFDFFLKYLWSLKLENAPPTNNPFTFQASTTAQVPTLDFNRKSLNNRMLFNFGKMFNDSTFCDVEIKVKTSTFPAHRCILAAHSDVFAAMFKTSGTERQSDTVVIEDLEVDGVREMLKFMYTHKCPSFGTIEETNLYRASQKYEFHELTKIVQSRIASNVLASNVLDLMELGVEYEDSDIKDAAMRCLVEQKSLNLDFQKCAIIVRKHPTLFELLLKYSWKMYFTSTSERKGGFCFSASNNQASKRNSFNFLT